MCQLRISVRGWHTFFGDGVVGTARAYLYRVTGLSIVSALFFVVVGAVWVSLALARQKIGAFAAGVLFMLAGLAGVAGALNNPTGIELAIHGRDLLYGLTSFVAALIIYRLIKEPARSAV